MTSNMRRWLRIFAGRVAYVLGTNVHDDQIDEALSDMTTEHGDPPTGTVKIKQNVYESKEGGPQKTLKKMKYCRKCRKNICVCPPPPPAVVEPVITPEQEALHQKLTTQRMMDEGV